MRLRYSLGYLVLMCWLISALAAWGQQKPLTQQQVTDLVSAGLGDESGAKMIEQRGIDFQPTDDYLQRLQAAGAKEGFLAALRAAKSPAATNATPLSRVQIFSLLVAKIPTQRIALLIQERGIDFDATDEYYQEVQVAGGDDEVIAAIKTARVIKAVAVDPTAASRQAEMQRHAAHGAEFFQNQHYAEAASEYRAAVQLDPQNPDLRLTLGITLAWLNDWDGAISELREAVRLSPNNDRAHESLGAALKGKGDWDGAIAEEREAIRLNPNDPYAHRDLGEALEEKGDWDDAIAEEREAVHLGPNDADLHRDLGIAFGKMQDWDDEVAETRQALRLDPNSPARHHDLGTALGNKGDWDGDVAEQRAAVRLDPNNAAWHRELGGVLGARGDWDGDMVEERVAIHLNPTDADAHRELGIALANKKDVDGAVAEERVALQLDPNNPERHRDLADALAVKGDYDAEIAEEREVLRLLPNDAMAHCEIGAALYWKNDWDGDIAEQRQALRLNPNFARAHEEIGEACIRKDDWDSAVREFRAAILLNSQVANYHFGLALSLERKDDRQGALEEYHTAYQLDPTDADAKQAFERLSLVVRPAGANHGYLGIIMKDLNADLAKEYNSPDTAGALVQQALPGGPAEKAGLTEGDVVRKLNGQAVPDSAHLRSEAAFLAPGDSASLEILRYGQPIILHLTVTESPLTLAARAGGESVPEGPLRDITVVNLTPLLRVQTGIQPNVSGVVIAKIGDKSSVVASASGEMVEGDVIESVNHHPVHDVAEFTLWASRVRGRTKLQLNRRGQEISYEINFEPSRGSSQ